MLRIEREEQIDSETGEEIGNTQWWLFRDNTLLSEAFWLTEEDDADSMAELGLFPLEEVYPREKIEGYAEVGETLYVCKEEESCSTVEHS